MRIRAKMQTVVSDRVRHENMPRHIFYIRTISQRILDIKIKEIFLAGQKEKVMEQETRIAVVGIIVENKEAVGEVNQILHDYSPYIIGRMGLPYEKKHVNIISVIVDAPADRISALSGKLGKIRGISAKVMYSKKGQ